MWASAPKITYTLKLLEAKPEKDLENKSFGQRKEIGNKKRERGNFWFKRNEFNLAIQSYRRALEYLDETEGGISSPTADGELPVMGDFWICKGNYF
jgi:FK506-binding protein 8